MKAMIYIQCDARFNDFLLRKIGNKRVIECTVDRVRKIGEYSIISAIYECDENKELIECLKKLGDDIEVIVSNEENVTKRFVNAVIDKSGYIIRIGGDQILLDYNKTIDILEKIKGFDFYYEESLSNCLLPDIVSVDLLKRKLHEIVKANRYFRPLLRADDIKRLNMEVPLILHSCRANNYLGYKFAKLIIEEGVDIYKLSKRLSSRMNDSNSDLYASGILTSWILGDSAGEFFYDINGDINPWWCEAAANLVRDKIISLKGLRIFEWGSGNSTMFWTKYASEVISIEYDQIWFQKMKGVLPQNAIIKFYELSYDGEYCRALNQEDGLFDIILIDGRDRVRCAQNCIAKLKNTGIIIWDDTERDYYKEGYRYLKEHGFKHLELSGVLWGSPEVKQYTSFFYKNDNIFGL